jgi:hypothetical protein
MGERQERVFRSEKPPERESYESPNAARTLFDFYYTELLGSLEKHMESYYGFSRVGDSLKMDLLRIRHEKKQARDAIVTFLREYFIVAINSELRTMETDFRQERSLALRIKDSHFPKHVTDVLSFYRSKSPEEIQEFLTQAKKRLAVSSIPNYGGAPWVAIVEAAEKLWGTPSDDDIDHAVDLQHHGGNLFHKDERVRTYWGDLDVQTFAEYKKGFVSVLDMLSTVGKHASFDADPEADKTLQTTLAPARKFVMDLAKKVEADRDLPEGLKPILLNILRAEKKEPQL